MNESFSVLMKLILPAGMDEYFDLIKHQEDANSIHLFLKEKNIIPIEYATQKLISKGFFDEIKIQDFPLRGKEVYLYITRRRWLAVQCNKVVFRNWDLVAQGTRITKDFAAFLKEFRRYTSA